MEMGNFWLKLTKVYNFIETVQFLKQDKEV